MAEQGPAPDLSDAEPLRELWEEPIARLCLYPLCFLYIAHTQSFRSRGTMDWMRMSSSPYPQVHLCCSSTCLASTYPAGSQCDIP